MTSPDYTENRNLAETIRLIRFYKKRKFTDEETKEYIAGRKNLFTGHNRLEETEKGFNLWYFDSGKIQMIQMTRDDFFGLFYDDEFELDENKLQQIETGRSQCTSYTN